MSDIQSSGNTSTIPTTSFFRQLWSALKMPLLAILTAFILGALVILITSGSFASVFQAYEGLVRGAFLKQRGFSETLVATIPYIFSAWQLPSDSRAAFLISALKASSTSVQSARPGRGWHSKVCRRLSCCRWYCWWVQLGGAIWAGIAGFLKAKTGAHEVISTMMMNYISFRLAEFLVSGPLRDPAARDCANPIGFF